MRPCKPNTVSGIATSTLAYLNERLGRKEGTIDKTHNEDCHNLGVPESGSDSTSGATERWPF